MLTIQMICLAHLRTTIDSAFRGSRASGRGLKCRQASLKQTLEAGLVSFARRTGPFQDTQVFTFSRSNDDGGASAGSAMLEFCSRRRTNDLQEQIVDDVLTLARTGDDLIAGLEDGRR